MVRQLATTELLPKSDSDNKQPFHLIIDTSTYLRLLAATPSIDGFYCPGLLSIIEVMTKTGLIRPVFTSEVITEIMNSAGIVDYTHLFKMGGDGFKASGFFAERFNVQHFAKPFSRIEFLRRIFNLGAIFLTTSVKDNYLEAIINDPVLQNLRLANGALIRETTPEVLNEQLMLWKENAHIIQALKQRRIRGDIGEISCGAAAARLNGKCDVALLFQGNDVRARAIMVASGLNPFEDNIDASDKTGAYKHKPVPPKFNPHCKSFDMRTTLPLKDVGCLTTLGFLLPFIVRMHREKIDAYLIAPHEGRDMRWYQGDNCPNNSMRQILHDFLREASSRVKSHGFHEYNALKDLPFGDIRAVIKHEHHYVDRRYKSPWWDFVNSIETNKFAEIIKEIRAMLDLENERATAEFSQHTEYTRRYAKAATGRA